MKRETRKEVGKEKKKLFEWIEKPRAVRKRIEKRWFCTPSSYPANQFLSPKNTTRKCSKNKPQKKPRVCEIIPRNHSITYLRRERRGGEVKNVPYFNSGEFDPIFLSVDSYPFGVVLLKGAPRRTCKLSPCGIL